MSPFAKMLQPPMSLLALLVIFQADPNTSVINCQQSIADAPTSLAWPFKVHLNARDDVDKLMERDFSEYPGHKVEFPSVPKSKEFSNSLEIAKNILAQKDGIIQRIGDSRTINGLFPHLEKDVHGTQDQQLTTRMVPSANVQESDRKKSRLTRWLSRGKSQSKRSRKAPPSPNICQQLLKKPPTGKHLCPRPPKPSPKKPPVLTCFTSISTRTKAKGFPQNDATNTKLMQNHPLSPENRRPHPNPSDDPDYLKHRQGHKSPPLGPPIRSEPRYQPRPHPHNRPHHENHPPPPPLYRPHEDRRERYDRIAEMLRDHHQNRPYNHGGNRYYGGGGYWRWGSGSGDAGGDTGGGGVITDPNAAPPGDQRWLQSLCGCCGGENSGDDGGGGDPCGGMWDSITGCFSSCCAMPDCSECCDEECVKCLGECCLALVLAPCTGGCPT